MPGNQYIVDVRPRIPAKLARLEELAANLWYSWDRSTRALFAGLDPTLWSRVGHNPRMFLRRIDQQRLEDAAADPEFLGNLGRVLAAYDTYHREDARCEDARLLRDDDLVAYLCAEYGLHESVPIYSGGLGILAGHHCKTASDLRLPFVAVGLLYRAGYFSQCIDGEGRQIARYVETEFDDLPLTPACGGDGEPITVSMRIGERDVRASVWLIHAGHVRVYLLDTDVDGNHPDDREITHQLYGGDREMRLRQEMVLGVGAVRALRALGLRPSVWHMNEGHPAFSVLERIREVVADGADFTTALEAVAAATVFTTHTPVPAGHDHFDESLMRHYLLPYCEPLGIAFERLMALGRLPDSGPEFNLTTLAIRGSRHQNGVSRIHGGVSARICRGSWPEIEPEENPMTYVTNGVHVSTVLAEDWVDLFDSTFGVSWRSRLSDYDYWQRVHDIPDHLFWSVRQTIKSKTLAALREALTTQHLRNQVSEPHLDRMLRLLDPRDPNVLTIGFARRFATYKRATLLFRDLGWLRQLVADRSRPVVFVFAGKAHPADLPGQELLREVHRISTLPEFVGHVLLVEGYDLALARELLAGVDVWLNTPIYPLEASGTSGMKAAINGAINLSVADGWWGEGYEGDNGWAIRPSPHTDDPERRDDEDARTLHEFLQDDVVPLYYARGEHGYSSGWVHCAKRSMATVLPRFNMHRVVNEYTSRLYAPAAESGRQLADAGHAAATELARWKGRVQAAWKDVGIEMAAPAPARSAFGETMKLEVDVHLNGLAATDVRVELLLERDAGTQPPVVPATSARRPMRDGEEERTLRFAFQPASSGETSRFAIELAPKWCGRLAYRVRVYPTHELLAHPFEMGLMRWL